MTKQNGNALFLILIAVALFAALSYAVTQSGRGGGNTDKEKQELAISELAQYFALVEHEVQRLRIINGCTLEQISIETTDWPRSDQQTLAASNTSAPADGRCHIFKPDGNIDLKIVDQNLSYYTSQSYIVVDDVRFITPDLGQNSLADLAIGISSVEESFCQAIQEYFHDTSTIPSVSGVFLQSFVYDGTFFDHPNNWTVNAPGCAETTVATSASKFFVYYPLAIR